MEKDGGETGIDQSLPAIAPTGAFGVKNFSGKFFRTQRRVLDTGYAP